MVIRTQSGLELCCRRPSAEHLSAVRAERSRRGLRQLRCARYSWQYLETLSLRDSCDQVEIRAASVF